MKRLIPLAVLCLGTVSAFAQSNVVGFQSGSVSTNYSQGATGSVSRPLSAKLQENVSVTDFGADATGATDSTAAFNAAITALANGGRLTIPCGTYKINPTSSLKPVSGTVIQGSGPYCTTVQFTGTGNTPVWLINSYVNGTGGQGQFIKFQDFTMSGGTASTTAVCFSVGTTSLATAKVQNVTFDNMRVTSCGTSGVQINDVWDLNILDSDIAYNGGDGITITDPDAVTGLYITNTRIHNNTGHDISNTGAGTVTQLVMSKGETTYAGSTEVVVGNCRDCTFIKPWSEESSAGTAQRAFDITGCIECHIIGGHSNNNSDYVYASATVSDVIVEGSTMTNGTDLFINVPTGSTDINFGVANRSNVGVSVGAATAQLASACPNATSYSLTTSAGLAVNACTGFDIFDFFSNGTREAYMTNVGNLYLNGGLLSISGSTYTQFAMGKSNAAATLTRNVADAYSALIVNNANSSSTGDDFTYQDNGTTKGGIAKGGIPYISPGADVTSAATIAPTSAAFRMTGSGAVATITPPGTCGNAADSGCILHIAVAPSSTWTFTTGGNMAKACSAPTPGQLITVMYLQAQALWFPSC